MPRNPASSTIQQHGVFSDKPDIYEIVCGGNFFPLHEGEGIVMLAEAEEGGLSFSQRLGYKPDSEMATAKVREGKVLIGAKLFAGGGAFVRLTDNALSSVAEGWDRNFDNSALEVINSNGIPMLQVIYKTPYHVEIFGVFQGRRLFFVSTPEGTGSNSSLAGMKGYPLKRLFKYPSREYMGVEEERN